MALGGARKGSGRKRFKPTDADREKVEEMASVGIPHNHIAMVIQGGIDPNTLKKYFPDELRESKIKANAIVGKTLFSKAAGGDTSSLIFWAKTQMGWKETNVIEGDMNINVISSIKRADD